ncbi:hypothetical protein [Salinibacter ruber]|uniref:hypothetical protein n=1 Tax=Salinibacter ruber TaxID=146919 RepID=UPI0021699BD2|nr:hypothetical protein [Salinibacter ruber]MCS3651872.1 hypothetical protein [Salinibacter ruber]
MDITDELTREVRERTLKNGDDPQALLKILYDLSTWSDDQVADLQREIIGQVSELIQGSFPWPETNAPTGDGNVDPDEWPDVGLLGKLGYEVGKSGKDEHRRRNILQQAIQVEADEWLPIEAQAEQWGDPSTENRLEKIANSLSAFARNAKKRDNPSLETAISHWQEDLKYLKERYYEPRHAFEWPNLEDTESGVDKSQPTLPFDGGD